MIWAWVSRGRGEPATGETAAGSRGMGLVWPFKDLMIVTRVSVSLSHNFSTSDGFS